MAHAVAGTVVVVILTLMIPEALKREFTSRNWPYLVLSVISDDSAENFSRSFKICAGIKTFQHDIARRSANLREKFMKIMITL